MTLRMRSEPPSGAKVRPERRPLRVSSLARSMLNASTRVDGQGQADLVLLVAVGQALGDVADLGVVGGGQRQQADLLEAGGLEALLDHLADAGDGPLAHRAGDHAGLAEAAAAGAAAEDLDGHPLVHGLGERDERLLRVGPLVEVHDGVLGHAPRHAGAVRDDAGDAAVGQVLDVVEAPGRRRRRSWRGGSSSSSRPPGRPSAFQARMTSVISRTACSPSPMTAQSMKSAIGSGLNAAWPPASTIGWSTVRSCGVQRDARRGRAR